MILSVHCLSAILDQIRSASTTTVISSWLFPPGSHKTLAGTHGSGWVVVWLIPGNEDPAKILIAYYQHPVLQERPL